MKNYADRLITEIEKKGNPCMVGLDPRLDQTPEFILSRITKDNSTDKVVEGAITEFNRIIIQTVKNLVPAVKLQIAFYEQYGIPGLCAFQESIRIAKESNLIVVVDAKRNDIGSTAMAYANSLLGRTDILGKLQPIYDVDCITVTPFLGRDSLMPFVETCLKYGKGIFILVKTSNPSSVDIQDQIVKDGNEPVYVGIAQMVDELGKDLIGEKGYSSIGAVVGATFPAQATQLRKLMPKSIFLVPGYGAQGGTATDTIPCFNADKKGAVINASRSITYAHKTLDISEESFIKLVHSNTEKMISDVNSALKLEHVNG